LDTKSVFVRKGPFKHNICFNIHLNCDFGHLRDTLNKIVYVKN